MCDEREVPGSSAGLGGVMEQAMQVKEGWVTVAEKLIGVIVLLMVLTFNYESGFVWEKDIRAVIMLTAASVALGVGADKLKSMVGK